MGVEYRHYLLTADRTYALDADRVAELVERLRRQRFVLAPEHPSFGSRFHERLTALPHEATGGHAFRTIENPHAPRRVKDAEAAIPLPVPLAGEWIRRHRGGASSDALHDELRLVFPVHVPDGRFASFDDMGLRYPFTFGGDEPLYHDVEIHLSRDFIHQTSESTDPIETHCTCGEDLGYEPDDDGLRLAIECEQRIRAVCPRCGTRFDPTGRHMGPTGGLRDFDGGGAYRFALVVDCHKGWPRDRGELSISPALQELVASVLAQPVVGFGEFY